ncbi:MAG: hypothetical protein KDD62_03940, partial [Bdellovibrionales bacterium]|nr:hypothetical protein [Bdellovibrionales bacterium]
LKVNEWKVYKVGTNDDESKQFVEQSYSREPKFTLLPGSYLVEVRKDGVFQELEVTVEARRTTKEEIVFKPSAE